MNKIKGQAIKKRYTLDKFILNVMVFIESVILVKNDQKIMLKTFKRKTRKPKRNRLNENDL